MITDSEGGTKGRAPRPLTRSKSEEKLLAGQQGPKKS